MKLFVSNSALNKVNNGRQKFITFLLFIPNKQTDMDQTYHL